MKLALWGAGGHGGVVLDAIRQQGLYEPVAFLEEKESSSQVPNRHLGLPVFFGRNHLGILRNNGVGGMVIAIGDEKTRVSLAAAGVSAGFQLCTIVHPSAVICPDVHLGVGTVVCAGSIVQTGTQIGDNVVVNTGASVDHDCDIRDGVQLAPGVVLGGRVHIDSLSFVGIGATIINRIVVGRNCLIGAGAVSHRHSGSQRGLWRTCPSDPAAGSVLMPKPVPKISFVVPIYNMEPYIADCLNSILRQEGDHDYEVIVIDDASTDAGAEVIATFHDPRIRVLRHQENKGAAYTITEGLYAARGAYVARIDPTIAIDLTF